MRNNIKILIIFLGTVLGSNIVLAIDVGTGTSMGDIIQELSGNVTSGTTTLLSGNVGEVLSTYLGGALIIFVILLILWLLYSVKKFKSGSGKK